MINKFTQHWPHGNYGPDEKSGDFEFNTTKELIESIGVIANFRLADGFENFVMSGNCLMAEGIKEDETSWWWVLGYIEKPELIELDQWVPPVPEEESDKIIAYENPIKNIDWFSDEDQTIIPTFGSIVGDK